MADLNSPILVAYRNNLKPHQDPKPPLPYIKGYTLNISRHTPPAPRYEHLAELDTPRLQHASQLEWVLSNPPTEGTTATDERKNLTISSTLHIGLDKGPQVVVVRDEEEKEMVAKIYDPLYYEFRQYNGIGYDEPPSIKVDVSTSADSDYCTEAAAYTELQGTPFEGQATAKYFGSWTFSAGLEGESQHKSRNVRLILMEHIVGVCMIKYDPASLEESECHEAMKRILEISMEMSYAGIVHGDVAPRNIMLCPLPSRKDQILLSIGRIVFIDFTSSHLLRLLSPSRRFPVPFSPIHRWWGRLRVFCDAQWFAGLNEANEWLWKTFEDDPRYLPAIRDPKSSHGRPLSADIKCYTGSSSECTSSSTSTSSISSGGDTPFPYVVGTKISVMSHEPPNPFGWYYPVPSEWHAEDYKSAPSKLLWVASHPPITGIDGTDSRTWRITKSLRTGDNSQAQIVLTSNNLVAKIYDPLYYPTYDDYGYLSNVVYEAESSYSIESAAYRELSGTPFEGTITPRYHGSWTTHISTNLPSGKQILRPVRLILLEYVEGISMLSLDPQTMSKVARQNILRKVFEAESDLLLFKGVRHDDIACRNIIICGTNFEDPNLRVCIIDFNLSKILRILSGISEIERKKQNPIFERVGSMWEFINANWMSEEEAKIWPWDWWMDGNGGKYVMVEKRIVDEQERAIAPSMDEWRWAKARYEVGKDGKLSKLSEQLASTVDLEDGKAENADLDISGATKGQGKVEIGAVGELGKVVAKVDEKVENGNGLAHRLSTDRPEAAQKNQIESVQVKEEVGHKEECKETYDDGEEGGSALKKQKLLE